MTPTLTLCSLDRFCGMVDIYNYIFRVVNILTFIYQLTIVSSPIPNKYVRRASITSACILANTLLTHVTSISSACIHITALAFPLYEYLHSHQYPRIYAMRPSGENPQPGQPRQQLLDQGINPEG